MRKLNVEANHIVCDEIDSKIVVFAWQNQDSVYENGQFVAKQEASRAKLTMDLEEAKILLADLQEHVDYLETVA